MSHLNCAFTLRVKCKHQFDTYLVKIHLVVLFFAISRKRDIGILQNWTRKQEVGHCDLILQPIFFNLITLKGKVPLIFLTKYQPNIP